MGSVWSWISENLLPTPKLRDHAGVDAIWSGRKEKAVRRLGTVAEAGKTLADLTEAGQRSDGMRDILLGHCRENFRDESGEWRVRVRIGDNSPVGDPNDVHHIIPPHHTIGYAVEDAPDGYCLEVIETLHCRRQVLRRHGKIIGVADTGMLRMERYGPCRVC